VGLPAGVIPRKSEPAYARVIVFLLQQARRLDAPNTSIERLVYVGDTRLNDGTAFANICRAGRWPGMAFIGSERDELPNVEISQCDEGILFVANRWGALSDFDRFCSKQEFWIDGRTAVIVDLDKTALGARGRNDHVIDQARVEAVRLTVETLVGARFDAESFRTAYDCLNQPEFHPFTSDNQDYLAYVCLILASGLDTLDDLVTKVRDGRMATFGQFIARVQSDADELASDLLKIHSDIHDRVEKGDPTPFKTFRLNEYRTTVARMGGMDDDASVSELLEKEIVITQEVREAAMAWKERGALLFGLSDKPDEASVPTDDLAAQGYRAIHRMETHAVGG
jgi:hypothetical protein